MVRAVPHLLLGQGIISLQDARGAQEPSKQGAPCCAQCLASFWVAGSPACRKWSVHRKHQTYGVWPILLERVLAHHITSLQKARGVGSAPEEAKKSKHPRLALAVGHGFNCLQSSKGDETKGKTCKGTSRPRPPWQGQPARRPVGQATTRTSQRCEHRVVLDHRRPSLSQEGPQGKAIPVQANPESKATTVTDVVVGFWA